MYRGALLNKAWKGGEKQDGAEGEAGMQHSFNRRHWYGPENCPSEERGPSLCVLTKAGQRMQAMSKEGA